MKPAATREPTRETTAMIIDTMSTMAEIERQGGLKFPTVGVDGSSNQEDTPLGVWEELRPAWRHSLGDSGFEYKS